MDKKSLQVNCAICDMRAITEELADLYHEISVNAALVYTNKKASIIMAKAGIKVNALDMMNLPDEVDNQVINGRFELKKAMKFQKPTILVVNGTVIVMPDDKEAFENIVEIYVKGTIMYPDNMEGKMPKMVVNGAISVYPWDAILLNDTMIVDKIFIQRAKSEKYYAKNKIMILDSQLDIKSLVEKDVVFFTKKAYVVSSLLNMAITLFDDQTDIVEIPDDCAFVNGDVELDHRTFCRYGSRLFIDGNLSINEDGLEELKKIEYLRVTGELKTYEEFMDDLNQIEHYERELVLCSNQVKYIEDKISFVVTKSFIEKTKQQIIIKDCAVVKIDKDIPKELLDGKVRIEDCGTVECSKEQKNFIQMITINCGMIRTPENTKEDEKHDCEPIVVNSLNYVF